MAFVSKFAAEFEQGLLANIQAILEGANGANAALAEIDASLSTFVDYDTPIPIALNFPALYLEPVRGAFKQSDDDSYIEGEYEFVVNCAIVGSDPDALKVAIVKYVRAIDQCLRTATGTDIAGAVTDIHARPAWEVTEHQYGPLFADERTIYRKNAQLTLVVQLLER